MQKPRSQSYLTETRNTVDLSVGVRDKKEIQPSLETIEMQTEARMASGKSLDSFFFPSSIKQETKYVHHNAS